MWRHIPHATVLRWMDYCDARNPDELKKWLARVIGVHEKIVPYYSGGLSQADLRLILESIEGWKEGVEWFEQAKVGEATAKLYVHWRQVR